MFLKVIFKTIKATGERKRFYRLCESYRFDNTVRHQTILHLGSLDELPLIDQRQALAVRINELVKQHHPEKQSLFQTPDPLIETLAQKYFAEIKEKQRLDIAGGKDYQGIDTDTVTNKNVRESGAEWLCMQALDQLNIRSFLTTISGARATNTISTYPHHQPGNLSCKRTAYQPMEKRKLRSL